MTARTDTPITEYLDRVRDGDDAAFDELLPLIYQELRALARSQEGRHRLRVGTESLVHEAYLRMVRVDLESRNRGQFFALASKAMRSLLVDSARRAVRIKRGGDQQRIDLDPDELVDPGVISGDRADDLIAIDQALRGLHEHDRQLAEIVECRFFGGLSVEETADALELSTATVKRRWAAAKLRLYTELKGGA